MEIMYGLTEGEKEAKLCDVCMPTAYAKLFLVESRWMDRLTVDSLRVNERVSE